jgi:hypothetical protein
MASLPSPMRRRLAVVDNDGDGVTGDNDDNYFDDATDFHRRHDGVVALVTMASYDGDSATGDEVDGDDDGATGYNDNGNDNDDDNDDDDTSSMTSDEGDNRRGRQSQSR